MRAMACAAAALMLGFTVACGDRDRQDTEGRIDDAAEEVGANVREGAEDVGDAADDAVDRVDATFAQFTGMTDGIAQLV